MQVSILGAKDTVLRATLKTATRCFAEVLMSPQMIRHLSIKIILKENLDAGGYCQSDDDRKPRNFTIQIYKSRRKFTLLEILAHEMIHVKQMATGQLKDVSINRESVVLWCGVVYEHDVSYWDQPWEIEAYGLQNSLVAKYLTSQNQFKYFNQRPSDWLQ